MAQHTYRVPAYLMCSSLPNVFEPYLMCSSLPTARQACSSGLPVFHMSGGGTLHRHLRILESQISDPRSEGPKQKCRPECRVCIPIRRPAQAGGGQAGGRQLFICAGGCKRALDHQTELQT